jgi:hypothetical protein
MCTVRPTDHISSLLLIGKHSEPLHFTYLSACSSHKGRLAGGILLFLFQLFIFILLVLFLFLL